ncbi:MAG: ABC transporter permease, partial [Bradyrhizobium sp.]|nr:ABC transporter permease [Bradyrhizobium sp.]
MSTVVLSQVQADPRRFLKALASQEALLAIAVIVLAVAVGLYNP